ncbi:cellulase family glycosylhydrolase [Clostridium sp. Sa3CUN1]|uniref:Endoglucanase n=1 Tax=Clostridium gallinarum TaxID=2762246 RepID=A0ABR8Q556_9CLOT|nr:cellulase family glycosylhydrolase [Clostridium gallinarum]MBD7915561.1 cellulase family glycosylhydrolase [Clostridium gallinarum]
MSFKKVFACFLIIILQFTGCSNSYDYQNDRNIENSNIGYDLNTDNVSLTTTSKKEEKKSTLFEYVDLQNATSNSYYGKLHVNGKFLSDKNNKPVQLKGISTHGIAWFPQYINKDTFKTFKEDWNMNVIRLSMYTEDYGGYCSSDNNQKEYLKSLIYKGIDAAKELNMYVIVDWHILNDKNPLIHVDEAIKFFNEVSSKYGNDPHILYEICNEPNGDTSWEDIKSYSNKVIPVIRNNAPDSIIIVGTPNWSQDVDIASESPIENYDNLMYSLHFYADTHKDDLRNKMNKAIENGLPIFVTEYGLCDASGNGSINIPESNKWINALNKNNISYVAWNLSNKDESSAILSHLTEETVNFSSSDLSASGEWIKYMLTKNYTKNENNDYIDEEENEFVVEDSKEEIKSEDSTINNSSNAINSSSNTINNSSNTTNNVENISSNNNENTSTNNSYNNQSTSNSISNNNNNNNNSTNDKINNSSNNSNSTETNSTSFEKDLIKSASASSNLSTSINLESSWEESGKMCYLYRITLTNTSSTTIDNWTINIALKNDIELRNFWNSSAISAGNSLTLNSLHYNKTINPNSSVSDIGFIIKSK